MKEKMFIFVVLPGLCFLPACFPRLYIPVEQAVTWAEAQSFCRGEYTDLATVGSNSELNQLVTAAQKLYNDNVWIGLYDDTNSWKWSLQKEGFYGDGESMFRMWKSGEPNNVGGLEDCVGMNTNGLWNDCTCQNSYQFACYNGSGETVDPSSYIFVPSFKMWSEAQRYCRKFYTDLVSVRNQTEYEEIKILAQSQTVWIGLYRDSWKWSDGSPMSFANWNPSLGTSPVSYINTPCVVLHQGQWNAHTCGDKLFFVCYDDPGTQQIVRVKVSKNNSSVNLENATEAILQQFVQILKESGLSENIKLTWRMQPDGKIFNLNSSSKKVKEEELVCGLK